MNVPNGKVYYWLYFITVVDDVINRVKHHERPSVIEDRFGTHGVTYGTDDTGEYVVVGFQFPAGIYAEIEDGTYGTLQGLRIYYNN